MRVTARIPADRGRVASVSVQVRVEDLPDGVAVDVTDVQLQAGRSPTGAVRHPSDLALLSGVRQWRNGVVPRSTTIIALGNPDSATPTRVYVSGSGEVRVGSYRFGQVNGSAEVDGEAGTASQGWGRPPVLTERSDLHARVDITAPVHVTVEWAERT